MGTMHEPLPSVPPVDVPEGAPVLDVREDDEWAEVRIPWAQHVPLSALVQGAREIEVPEDAPLVVACHVGGRSAQVVAWLRSQGVDAVNLAGGMAAWEGAGRTVERSAG
jgi:rhodanese-related sulfurtransferase